MKSSKEKWIEAGEKLLRQIGIREHQKVVDFGCGSGNYALSAARIVRRSGLVYALDKDKKVLNELMHKAESMGMKNIIRHRNCRRISFYGKTSLILPLEE